MCNLLKLRNRCVFGGGTPRSHRALFLKITILLKWTILLKCAPCNLLEKHNLAIVVFFGAAPQRHCATLLQITILLKWPILLQRAPLQLHNPFQWHKFKFKFDRAQLCPQQQSLGSSLTIKAPKTKMDEQLQPKPKKNHHVNPNLYESPNETRRQRNEAQLDLELAGPPRTPPNIETLRDPSLRIDCVTWGSWHTSPSRQH